MPVGWLANKENKRVDERSLGGLPASRQSVDLYDESQGID